jgi:threonine dehydratase
VSPELEPSLEQVRAAQARLGDSVLRSPLVRLELEGVAARVHVKLECLQPIGSFKLRGAGNALLTADPARLRQGVYTASAGNMAQGVAWWARRLGVPCAVVVPEHAPETKLRAIERLEARIVKVPFDRWWQTLVDRSYPGMEGVFVHPVSDPAVIAGNGTVALEILEELPEVDTLLVPYGGGGLSCGIAAVARASKPQVQVFACEVETAAPLRAALRAGEPRAIEYTPSFVDGIGGKTVLAEMWPLARRLLAGSRVVPLSSVATAVRLLAERCRVVAEGAGATPVAAAMLGLGGEGSVVCVVSGGNIDALKLARILEGGTP